MMLSMNYSLECKKRAKSVLWTKQYLACIMVVSKILQNHMSKRIANFGRIKRSTKGRFLLGCRETGGMDIPIGEGWELVYKINRVLF